MAGPPGHGPVIQLLEGTTIAQLCRPRQKIVLLEHNQSVGDALLVGAAGQAVVLGEVATGNASVGAWPKDGGLLLLQGWSAA